jgi:hypothetical protein
MPSKALATEGGVAAVREAHAIEIPCLFWANNFAAFHCRYGIPGGIVLQRCHAPGKCGLRVFCLVDIMWSMWQVYYEGSRGIARACEL